MHPLIKLNPYFARNLLLILALLAAVSMLGPAPANACDVVVVKSADLKPYRDALRGFKDASSCDVSETELNDDRDLDKIRRKRPDVVLAIGTTAFKKLRTLDTVPVVYVMAVLAEADRALPPNISGVSMEIAPAAYLAAMKQVFPAAKRVGLLYDPRNMQTFVGEASREAAAAGLELTNRPVPDPAGLAAALGSMRDAIDILWVLPDPTVVTPETIDYLLRFSIQYNIPLFAFSKKYIEMGAIASLDADPFDMGAQAADLANSIVAGGKGAVRLYARKTRLSINRKAANKMGVKIDSETARRVDHAD
jgi:putative ABC transport system substrate-binding protein